MEFDLKFISADFFELYSQKCNINISDNFIRLSSKSDFNTEEFEYYIISSSLYSSKIEGNTLDANSFFRNRGKNSFPKKKKLKKLKTWYRLTNLLLKTG